MKNWQAIFFEGVRKPTGAFCAVAAGAADNDRDSARAILNERPDMPNVLPNVFSHRAATLASIACAMASAKVFV